MLRRTPDIQPPRPLGRSDASHAEPFFARSRVPRERRGGETPGLDGAIAFLAGSLDPAALANGHQEATRLGVTADAALLAARVIDDEGFYRALARRLGLSFVKQDVRLAPGLDLASAAQAGIAPLQRWPGGPRWIIAPRGRDIAGLRGHLHARDVVLTTPRNFQRLLRESDPARAASDAATTLLSVAPGMSAHQGLSPAFWPAAGAGLAALVAFAWLASGLLLFLIVAVLWCGFSAAVMQRLVAIFAGLERQELAPPLSLRALPTYTIVIALYREANMASDLIAAIEAIDYPRAKLEVKFVVEADDHDTFDALARRLPGVEYDVIVAPPGAPRTKPRALNIALPFSRGDLLAVFDAEDRPDPQQLRLAAAAMSRMPPDVACVQARLAIDNERKNWLQALYALDYAALFGVQNPGLAYFGLPIFLGGTSNHFRRAVLADIGGWDAWNVTEDADLGVRLARFGHRVETFDCRTDEEAPVTWRGFLAQRVRWKKGWMQTALVHLRHPRRLLRDLGLAHTASLLATFLSGIVAPLFWPLFAVAVACDASAGDLLAPDGMLRVMRSTLVLGLVVSGALAMILPLVIAGVRFGLKRYLVCLPLLPLWHVVLCVSAWLALIEFGRDPHRWAKTEHGLAARPKFLRPEAVRPAES